MKLLHKILFVLAISLLIGNRTNGQATLSLPTMNAVSGNVAVNVNATGLNDMVSFQFTITYDHTKLTYVSISNWYSGITNVMVNNNASQGFVTFSYFNVNPVSLNSGVFFTMNFTYTSGTANLNWSNTPTPLNIMTSSGQEITPTLTNGSVSSMQNYTITTSSNPTDGGSTNGGGIYQNGQTCTLAATPNNGYTFSNWTEGATVVSTNANYTFTVSGNRTLVANFTLNPVNYTITTTSNPSAGGTTSGGGTYQSGNSCSLTASANSGYTFSNWTEGATVVSNNANYTFTVTSNRALVANFIQSPVYYTIATSSNPNAGGTTNGAGSYQNGQSCTVTATANIGYTFVNWTVSGNIVSTDASYTFTVNANRTLSANFVQNPTNYTITTSSNPTAGGTTSGAGSYQNGQSCTVTATANNGYSFSNWTEGATVVSSNANYTFTVTGNRTLVANFISYCEPDWTPLPNLQFNMQIVAQILIDDQVSLNPNDVFGAFVGDECRGIASPDPALDGKIFLTIGSNVASGEQIELKIWNSSDCSDCNAIPGFEFVNQGEIGTFLDPYQLRCGAIQDITFGQGYTWFSLNVNPGSMTPASLFTDLTPCYDDRVIGQTSFALFTGSTWVGSLTNLGMDKMYRMKLCSQQSMSLMGDAAPLSPISLSNGYTWLGYQPQQCQSVSAAMAGLSPGPSYDDRVIGQNSFALFTGSTWVGSLTQMCPGKGYVIKLANAQTLTYPESTSKSSTDLSEEIISPTGVYPVEGLQHTMMVVGRLQLNDGSYSTNPKDVIYGFVGEECRGIAIPSNELNGLIFMSIGSNMESGEMVSFKVWIDAAQTLLPLNELIPFEAMQSVGGLDNPFLFTLGEMVGVDEMTDGIWIGEPFPNPFNEQTTVPYFLNEAAELSFNIYDSRAVKVRALSSFTSDKGHQQFSIERIGLAKGVYVLKVNIVNNTTTVIKMTKMIIN